MKTRGCVALLLAGFCCHGGPLELLKNTGFEEIEKDAPVGWSLSGGSVVVLSSTDTANHGQKAAKLKLLADNGFITTGASTIAEKGIPVATGATYRASVWARGEGNFNFLAVQYTASTNFIGSQFGPGNGLVQEWRQYEFKFKITDPVVKVISLGLMLSGKGSEALFDDVSLVFDPADNPGIAPDYYVVKIPELKTRLLIKTADAALKNLWLNGVKADATGVTLKEGLNIIGVEAEAAGAAPGVSIRVDGAPYSTTAWKLSPTAPEGWLAQAFDDSRWTAPATRGDGLFWGDKDQKTLFLRQVVVWNETHNGPLHCLLPNLKSLSFCPDTMEVIQLALYTPLPTVPKGYTFTIDLPRGFRLMDKLNHGERWIMNIIPESIEARPITRDGQQYVRYTLAFPARRFSLDATSYSNLPIRLDRDLPPGTKTAIYCRRQAENFVELEQVVPVDVLPPLRGKQPRDVRIQLYSSYPTGYSVASNEVIDQLARQTAQAGVNRFITGWKGDKWGTDYAEAAARFTRRMRENGVRLTVWADNNFPFYGLYSENTSIEAGKHAYSWMKDTPAARARYFNDDPKWGTAPSWYMYCPTYALGAGREKFKGFIRELYQDLFKSLPDADELFLDWESHVWANTDGVAGKGSWCFCDLCRKSFAATIGKDDISDAEILSKRRGEWSKHRSRLDGGVALAAKEVCAEFGKKLQFYCQTHELELIDAAKGVDALFVGCPGNGVANARFQKNFDVFMDKMEKGGVKRVVGQRFPYWLERGKDAWRKATVLSDDGVIDSRSWKPQIVRVVASLHGGVDLQGSYEFVGGMLYYVGEATRLICEYEDLFYDGERADKLAESPDIAWPDLLVLRKGEERLVLLFNEDKEKTRRVKLRNLELKPGAVARIFDKDGVATDPAEMTVDIPPEDVVTVYVQNPQ